MLNVETPDVFVLGMFVGDAGPGSPPLTPDGVASKGAGATAGSVCRRRVPDEVALVQVSITSKMVTTQSVQGTAESQPAASDQYRHYLTRRNFGQGTGSLHARYSPEAT